MKTRVKICGITSIGDAVAVSRLGADEIGLNFYPESPRYLDPEAARKIVLEIPGSVSKVGVFVNADIDEILACADFVGLDVIQLHGDESPDYVLSLRERTRRFIIKAATSEEISERLESFRSLPVDALLIDSPHTGGYGGTGQVFDWNSVKESTAEFGRIYLAGGLGPGNVGRAVRTLRPFAVDACSRLESSKGKKDLAKVEQFIREVREAR